MIKPFKGSHSKISLTRQVIREVPEADVVKVAEKNLFSTEGRKRQ